MRDRAEFADCRNCLCLNARREAHRLTRLYEEKLRPFGLSANQFSMLSMLILAGPLPVTVLAERLGVDRTTMTRNLAVSERDSLITTAPGKDKRSRLIEIAPRGRDIADKALPAWREAQAAAVG